MQQIRECATPLWHFPDKAGGHDTPRRRYRIVAQVPKNSEKSRRPRWTRPLGASGHAPPE
jgi:hypothetical protein